MILAFDTETSGIYRHNLPASDPSQPHIVQIAAKLFDKDWNAVSTLVTLIKPDGWTIEAEATAVHGITELMAIRRGVDIVGPLLTFRGMAEQAHRIVAYNLHGFDRLIISAALAKIGSSAQWWDRMAPRMECAMEIASPLCRIAGSFGEWKHPSLTEAHAILCPDIPWDQTHDAESDLMAMVRVYRKASEKTNTAA